MPMKALFAADPPFMADMAKSKMVLMVSADINSGTPAAFNMAKTSATVLVITSLLDTTASNFAPMFNAFHWLSVVWVGVDHPERLAALD